MSDQVLPCDSNFQPLRRVSWRSTWALIACMTATTLACANEPNRIFQVDDVPGEIHLTDDAWTAGVERLPSPPANPATRAGADVAFAPALQAAARRERLDPDLLRAVMAIESRGQPGALSPRGAAGLMQLMPAVARVYGVTDVFDPVQNIAAGAHLLRSLLDRYHQDVARALAAYNAGTPAIDRWRADRAGWPSAETTVYVPRVLARFALLRSAAAPVGAQPRFQP